VNLRIFPSPGTIGSVSGKSYLRTSLVTGGMSLLSYV
jgi:hypothetical protein